MTLIVLCFSLFAGLTVWFSVHLESGFVAGAAFFAACAVGIYFHYFKRCPQCHHRLEFRRDPIGATFYRAIYCCDRCQIDWDSNEIGDTRHDD
jgi:hypothetical protein